MFAGRTTFSEERDRASCRSTPRPCRRCTPAPTMIETPSVRDQAVPRGDGGQHLQHDPAARVREDRQQADDPPEEGDDPQDAVGEIGVLVDCGPVVLLVRVVDDGEQQEARRRVGQGGGDPLEGHRRLVLGVDAAAELLDEHRAAEPVRPVHEPLDELGEQDGDENAGHVDGNGQGRLNPTNTKAKMAETRKNDGSTRNRMPNIRHRNSSPVGGGSRNSITGGSGDVWDSAFSIVRPAAAAGQFNRYGLATPSATTSPSPPAGRSSTTPPSPPRRTCAPPRRRRGPTTRPSTASRRTTRGPTASRRPAAGPGGC